MLFLFFFVLTFFFEEFFWKSAHSTVSFGEILNYMFLLSRTNYKTDFVKLIIFSLIITGEKNLLKS